MNAFAHRGPQAESTIISNTANVSCTSRAVFAVELCANGNTQLEKYLRLPQKGKVIAEYVWIDGSNGVRSKCKVSIPPNFSTLYVACGLALSRRPPSAAPGPVKACELLATGPSSAAGPALSGSGRVLPVLAR